MIRRDRGNHSESGFVLAEALVCVILIALTIALIGATLTFGRRVADAGREREQRVQVSTGVAVLADWLAQAVPLREIEAGGNGRVLFEGQASRLSFPTLSQGDAQPGGILTVTVSFAAPTGGTGGLVFTATPLPLGMRSFSDAGSSQQLLVGNLVNAQFRYFGVPTDGEAPRWLERWTNATRMPDIVALSATLSLGPRPEPLDLTFRVLSQ